MDRSAITFNARYYEVILDNGRVSFVDVNAKTAPVSLPSGGKKIMKPESARKQVMRYLRNSSDPGMTFSD